MKSVDNYYLIIKSGTDIPDIERCIEASSWEEAVETFVKWLAPYGWSRKTIERNIVVEKHYAKPN